MKLINQWIAAFKAWWNSKPTPAPKPMPVVRPEPPRRTNWRDVPIMGAAVGEYSVLDSAGATKYFVTASGSGSSGAGFVPQHTVDGTVTANAGTNLNTSALALEAGGNLAAIKTDVDKIPSQGQALAAASMPVVLTAAQITTLTPPAAITGFALETTLGTTNTEIGIVTETAPATDTASSGLNGRLQRIAQRLTSIIALLPTALGAGGGLKVDGSGTALPVSGTVTANAGTASKATATAIATLMSTELNSLANGSFATATNGLANTDRWGDFEFVMAVGSNATANATIDLYFLVAYDGSNYTGTTGPPPGALAGSFVCQAETAGRYILRNVPLPISTFKTYVKNGSGQNLSASGSTLKLVSYS